MTDHHPNIPYKIKDVHEAVDAIAMILPAEIAQITPIHKGYKIDWTS